jgi:hypothetical protein
MLVGMEIDNPQHHKLKPGLHNNIRNILIKCYNARVGNNKIL